MSHQILLVSQDPQIAEAFRDGLGDGLVELGRAACISDACDALRQGPCDLIVISDGLLGESIGAALGQLRSLAPETPIFLAMDPDRQRPHDITTWFEVLPAPLEPRVARWLCDAILYGRPSKLFKLYVSGSGRHAQACAERVRAMLDRSMHGEFELEIVDILREPNRARLDQARATPTLVRMGPRPRRQVVGVDDARVARLWDPAEVHW